MARKQAQQGSGAQGNSEPDLVPDELVHVSGDELELEGGLEGALLQDTELVGREAASVLLAEVCLRRVDLSGTRLRGLRLREVLASAVNGANGSWPYAEMDRVTFAGSTLVGLDLGAGRLARTTFSECKLDLANLRMADIRDVVFEGCSLRGTDFYGAKLSAVRFDRCELHETDFSQAALEHVDLRGSTLVDVRGVGALRGAIVDPGQLIELAPALAAELGIRVEGVDV
jgi:uncharacterized protein YjbI with pentapeptide repeats